MRERAIRKDSSLPQYRRNVTNARRGSHSIFLTGCPSHDAGALALRRNETRCTPSRLPFWVWYIWEELRNARTNMGAFAAFVALQIERKSAERFGGRDWWFSYEGFCTNYIHTRIRGKSRSKYPTNSDDQHLARLKWKWGKLAHQIKPDTAAL